MDLEPEVYCTPITAKLSALLARDTLKIAGRKGHVIPYYTEEIQEFERKVRVKGYRKEFTTNGHSVCFYDAGHIPGSSMIHLEKEKQSLFYTGDLNTISTELQKGADTKFPESDILLIESTYFGRNHTPRKILEEKFIKSIRETVDIGGRAIIPAFGIGRTQEIMLILKKHGLPAFVDGMGVDVFNLFKRAPEYIRDINNLEKAFTSSTIVKWENRETIINRSSIIVTSAGMLNGGPVLYYLDEIYNDPKSKVFLTGYQAQDTNGRSALERGYIVNGKRTVHLNCRLELYDFSAHCGDVQLKEVVKKFCDNGTETVIAVHGDDTEGFANWIREETGVESFAPANQEKISIERRKV
jgi:putative mRNA 3-end processing factor